jgi:hypothetical protein
MSEKPTALQVNAQTGEIIERELTSDEILELESMVAEEALVIAEQKAKEAARISALSKLAALGLTQDEIDAL